MLKVPFPLNELAVAAELAVYTIEKDILFGLTSRLRRTGRLSVKTVQTKLRTQKPSKAVNGQFVRLLTLFFEVILFIFTDMSSKVRLKFTPDVRPSGCISVAVLHEGG